MNPASKNKLLIWCVVLLMIANVAVLATIWVMHQKVQPQPGRGTPGDFLIKQLGLDAKQQEQFSQLRRAHQEQSVKIRGEIKDARDSFFKLLQQPNVNDSIKNAASGEVARHLQALDLLTFDHFKKLRDMCTPSQQKKFDEIIEDVLRTMINPSPPPGGRPPRDGRPPLNGNPPPGDNMPPPPDH